MTLRPLRVEFKLGGLMAVTSGPSLMLDALLLSAATQCDPVRSADELSLPLAMASTTEFKVWLASRVDIEWCGPSQVRQLFRNPRPLGMLENDDLHTSTVRLDRGATRTSMNTLMVRQAVRAEAWCLGDANGVQALLEQLTHLGAYRHADLGRVSALKVVEDESARVRSWLRPLPGEHPDDPFAERVSIMGASSPPYWQRSTAVARWPIE